MKQVLSAVQLSQEVDELIAELEGRPADRSPLYIRCEPSNAVVFPEEGYESWEHRWFQGTGKAPAHWLLQHSVL